MRLIDADSLKERIMELIDCNETVFTDEQKPEPIIKVGDKVIVKDKGKKYSRYIEWFENNNVPVRYAAEYELGGCYKGTTGTVVLIAPHGCGKRMLILFETDERNTFLFDEDGLELDE